MRVLVSVLCQVLFSSFMYDVVNRVGEFDMLLMFENLKCQSKYIIICICMLKYKTRYSSLAIVWRWIWYGLNPWKYMEKEAPWTGMSGLFGFNFKDADVSACCPIIKITKKMPRKEVIFCEGKMYELGL